MANDPGQDKDFLAAPREQQHAYLSSIDPDYAKAPKEEQDAYLQHVTGGPTNETLSTFPAQPPKPTIPTSGPSGSLETLPQKIAKLSPEQEQRRQSGESMAVPEAMLSGMYVGAIGNPIGAAKRLAGGAILGGVGQEVGGRGGRLIGPKSEIAGRVIGGALGTYVGMRDGNVPVRQIAGEMAGKISPTLGDYINPPAIPPEEAARGAFMNRGYKPAGDAEYSAKGAFMNKGYRPTPPPAPPPKPPEPPISGVSIVPEPRPQFPGENPNYEASVPRDELEEQAQRGKPGAGKQLQQIGRTILYKPKPTIGRK